MLIIDFCYTQHTNSLSTQTITITATATTTDVATITDTTTITDVITDVVQIPETATTTIIGLKKRFDMEKLVRHPSVTLAARQETVAPSSIPAYASACSGSVRYSSACSCIGVQGSISTAATPITTLTVTATAIQTSIVTQTSLATQTKEITTTILHTSTIATQTIVDCGPAPTFVLSAVGGTYNGQYAQVVATGDGADDAIQFGPVSSASTFKIDAAGHLHVGNEDANTESGATAFLLYFDTPAQVSAEGYVYATCSVSPSQTLQCVDQTASTLQTCPGLADAGSGVVIGTEVLDGCSGFHFLATCKS